ncbi:hypothetical protein OPV22_029891 [Ensete ventricosum]|uniref:Uncharacterized protein n=1 Tax=Ensete ventricosum TaxID=4639 RepID=A0AAV8Q793_ENSVE|nr:hypothetical protein OPV22_029891 [Ensete ventricosum]
MISRSPSSWGCHSPAAAFDRQGREERKRSPYRAFFRRRKRDGDSNGRENMKRFVESNYWELRRKMLIYNGK